MGKAERQFLEIEPGFIKIGVSRHLYWRYKPENNYEPIIKLGQLEYLPLHIKL
jgi:hypothetical protein